METDSLNHEYDHSISSSTGNFDSNLNSNLNFDQEGIVTSHSTASNSTWCSYSSSMKRVREEDYSSDGTLSSTFSFPIHDTSLASHPNAMSNSNGNTRLDGCPTSSFKRMKLGHSNMITNNTVMNTESHNENTQSTSHIMDPHHQNHQHEHFCYTTPQSQHSNNNPSFIMDTCYENSSIANEITLKSSSSLSETDEKRSKGNLPMHENMVVEYTSINKLLGNLHRNRKLHSRCGRDEAETPTVQAFSHPSQMERRQLKRTYLQTHSNLF